MKKVIKKLNNNGFSFIEVVLYLAIVAILLTAVIDFNLSLNGTATKVASNVDASRNRRLSLTAIDYLMKNADGLLKDVNEECSDFASSPEVLALYFDSDTYLPGTCVEGGGGVRIGLDNRQVKMTCYPNIPYNGWYQACSTSVFPAGNAYYLTGPETVVLDSSLSFSTSTATSTANNFIDISTVLTVGILSQGQINVAATSTATSTVAIRNQQLSGLVSWWKFDDSVVSAAVDSAGVNNLTCPVNPAATSTLVDGGISAYDFNKDEYDLCFVDNPDDLKATNTFTIATWLKMDYTTNAEYDIMEYHYESNPYKGYNFYVNNTTGDLIFEICDSVTCTHVLTASSILSHNTVYHVSAVYDLDNDIAKMYVYQKAVGGISTTTASSIPTLVNYDATNSPGIGLFFDGVLDEMRFYNRALTDEEIWALQSQGAN